MSLQPERRVKPPPTLTQQIRFASVSGGAQIAWGVTGRGDGPTLIRAQHWMTHLEFDLRSPLWVPFIERLGRIFRFIRFDGRGCGLSTGDDVAPSLAASLEELDAVFHAQGRPRVALLGASGGSLASIAYAAAYPERVSHLILLGGYARGALLRTNPPEYEAFFESLCQLIETGWGNNDAGVQGFFTNRTVPDTSTETRLAFNTQQRMCCNGRRAAAIYRSNAMTDVTDLARQVRVPTLILHSDGDAAVPVTQAHELATLIPDSCLEVLRSRNHLPINPDGAFEHFCEAVAAFVATGPDPALTDGERAVARLLGKGFDNRQIAARLQLAEKTVRNRLSVLYAKLGSENRGDAALRCRELFGDR